MKQESTFLNSCEQIILKDLLLVITQKEVDKLDPYIKKMLTLLEKQDIKNILAHLKVSFDDETNTCNKIFLKQKFETLDKDS